jgi:hypothetical protein
MFFETIRIDPLPILTFIVFTRQAAVLVQRTSADGVIFNP